MKIKLAALSAVAILTCALALPALACDGNKSTKSASTAVAADYSHCSPGAKSAVWAGAWLERSATGELTVVAVAAGSPAARAGVKPGDLVVAVNGRDLATYDAGSCLSKSERVVGASVAYTIQRGEKSKVVKVKLEKMPEQATGKFADRVATFEPGLAAVVVTSVD